MAKVYFGKHKSTYKKYRSKYKLKLLALFLLAVAGVVLTILTYKKSFGISLLLTLPFIISYRKSKNYDGILASGERGEATTLAVLKKLPSHYNILPDLIIEKARGQSQLDHLVIGKNGIFIVETKNHKGRISGDDSDVKILQKKKLASGRKYSQRFLNPSLQVATHARAVKFALKETPFKALPVIPLVFFSNTDVKLRVKSEEVKYFSIRFFGGFRLRRYIKSYPADFILTNDDRQKLINIFLKK